MDLNVNTRSDAGSGKKRNNQLQEEKEKENYRHWESEEGKQKKEEKKKIQPQKRKRRYENFMKKDSEEEDDDESASKLGKHPKSKPINLVTVGRCLTQQIDSSKIEVWQHPQPPKTIHLKLKDCSKNDNISVEIDNCKS